MMYSLIDYYLYNNSLVLLCLIPILSWISIWLFLFVLSWLLKTKYGSILRINGIRFFQLNGLTLLLSDGCKIEIDFIWLSVHLINSNNQSLIGINFSGCRIEGGNLRLFSSTRSKEMFKSSTESIIVNNTNHIFGNVDGTTSFTKQLKWLRYLRFLSINVTNIDLNQTVVPHHHQQQSLITTSKNEPVQNCLLNLSLEGLNIYYYNKGSSLVLKFSAHKVKGNVYKSIGIDGDADDDNHPPPTLHHHQTDESNLLADFSLDFEIQLNFNEDKIGVNIHLSGLKLSVHESLINLIDDTAASSSKPTLISSNIISKELSSLSSSTSSSTPPTITPPSSSSPIDLFKSFNFLYNFNDIIFTCEKLNFQLINNENDQILTLINDETEFRIGKKSCNHVNIDLIVNNLTLTSLSNESNYDIASLAKLSFQGKIQEESCINQCIKITNTSEIINLHITYNEMEINYWLNLINRLTTSSISSKVSQSSTNSTIKSLNWSMIVIITVLGAVSQKRIEHQMSEKRKQNEKRRRKK